MFKITRSLLQSNFKCDLKYTIWCKNDFILQLEDQSFAFSKGKKIKREKEMALFNFKLSISTIFEAL